MVLVRGTGFSLLSGNNGVFLQRNYRRKHVRPPGESTDAEGSPSTGNCNKMTGLKPIDVIVRVPKDWVVEISDREGGLVFRPPDPKLAKYNRVRIMVDYKTTRLPYARVLKNGSYVDDAGNKITGTTEANKESSGHIPLSW